jgi:arylesterase/paraoxonase
MTNLPLDWKGYHAHGMDVVRSTVPGEEDVAWVYAINHRPPEPPTDAPKVGADSVVEIFKTKIGSDVLKHVRTVRDYEHVVTPNELVGRPDGKGFWVSNDHKVKVGLVSIPLDTVGSLCG